MVGLGFRGPESGAQGCGLISMFAHRRRFPFAEFRLEIQTVSTTRMIHDAEPVCPTLPVGMRIDDCRLFAVSIACSAGETLTICLEVFPAEEWTAELATGEWLDGFELESRDGTAALGMRDPEWLCDRFGLVSLEASSATARPHRCTATYKSLSRTQIDLQAACAWTHNPKTEQEALSPWFAVDLAMTS